MPRFPSCHDMLLNLRRSNPTIGPTDATLTPLSSSFQQLLSLRPYAEAP